MRPLHTTLLALLALAPSAAAGGALTSLVAAAPAPAGKVFMDRDEALERAFEARSEGRMGDEELQRLMEERAAQRPGAGAEPGAAGAPDAAGLRELRARTRVALGELAAAEHAQGGRAALGAGGHAG
jgi:hypothetical protein